MTNTIELEENIVNKLLVYQQEHTKNIIDVLLKNITCLDASDTGTGKTYSAIAVCAQLKLKPIIISPKSVISNWIKVCKYFSVDPIMAVNYETIKNGKYYSKTGKRMQCPYLSVTKEDNQHVYKWHLEDFGDSVIFIFDEVHRCSDFGTQNGQLLFYSKNENKKMLLLSATIADRPDKFKLFFYILNFISPDEVAKKKISYGQYMSIMIKWIIRDAKPMYRIHTMLYPDRASRMRIDALGDLFPETQITATPYTMGQQRAKEIEREYKKLAQSLNELRDKSKKDKSNALTKMLRAHQKIEILKVPTFVEMTNDFIYNGFSVVIFVNYTQTLEKLSEMLYTSCLIYGEQTDKERQKNILDFQNNKSKIIIANIKAGGIGISLHDTDGKFPRASIISPTWSSIDLVQALGRIHRAGGKSKSLQRIIYAAETIEERIAEKIEMKLKEINSINNGDLDLTNVEFEDLKDEF